MGEKRNSYWWGKLKEKTTLGRPTHRWEDNKTYLQKAECNNGKLDSSQSL
jgi:hypothetical protein